MHVLVGGALLAIVSYMVGGHPAIALDFWNEVEKGFVSNLVQKNSLGLVIQKSIVPVTFLMSFGILFVLRGRAAGYGVLLFGFGWTGLVAWYGLL